MPNAPTRADAERALERLLRPFRGYLEHGSVRSDVDRCGGAAFVLPGTAAATTEFTAAAQANA
ncbi:MAG: hypothetical protein M3300_02040, partial [Actinomycetota bacterium]|nr:hypothetical protein [Actinomycetota bacterium]